ncbi:hypothetical protein AMECASPLE_014033 [Ameca splendens]|uniref:Uncharacterized protein n=1 Tax=Ameca splendens TaxID=208324 RepID=A0ABV0YZG9_9TELE
MNPVHPPPSTAPTSETLGPANHPGTPVFTILSVTVGIPVPVPCTFPYIVNKLITVKLSLLNCFLHVGQNCSKHYDRQGAVGCHCAAPGEHSGAKGLAQGPRVVICGIRTQPLVSPLEHKPPVLTTRPPLPKWDLVF